MNFRILLVFGLMTFCFVEKVYSQGKLIYLNGKEKRFETAEVKGEFIVYQPEGSKNGSTRKADLYNVFSILKDDGSEQVVYKPDTADGDPTVLELRDYILGEKHAIEVYKKPENRFIAFEVGLLSSLGGFYGIPIPILYSTIVGNVSPKLPKEERHLNNSEAFKAGYKKKARNIKTKDSLIGGMVGFTVGITAFAILFSSVD